MKKCTKCGVEKPVTEEYFCKTNKTKSGFRGNCKSCEFEYRELNKERLKTYNKTWRENNKEKKKVSDKNYQEANKDAIKINLKNWKIKNKEKIGKYMKKYSFDNKERERERVSVWRKENPNGRRDWYLKNIEGVKIKAHARRSKMRSLPSTLTAEQWVDVKKHFDHSCAYCGNKKPLEQDHFVPLTKDGEYTHNNIIPACKSCNSSKNNKDFFEWYSESKSYNKKREKNILDHLGYDKNIQQLSIL